MLGGETVEVLTGSTASEFSVVNLAPGSSLSNITVCALSGVGSSEPFSVSGPFSSKGGRGKTATKKQSKGGGKTKTGNSKQRGKGKKGSLKSKGKK